MTRLAIALVILPLVACADDPEKAAPRALLVTFEGAPAEAAGRATLGDLALLARWDDGKSASGVSLSLSAKGGGSVSPASLTTDREGLARFSWTLGPLPITNTVVADAGDLGHGELTVRVTPPAELSTAPFGEVEAFLAQRETDGSTEDLAWSPDGKLVMAHGGANAGLFTVAADGKVSAMVTSGTPLEHPLGLAYGADGALYVADGGLKALVEVQGSVASILQDRDGAEAFDSPNDVAVGRDGTVFLSDTCTGKVYAVSPTSGEVLARLSFDPATEGGPNGLVVGPDGALWMTTENPAIFCGNGQVEIAAEVAGLYRIPLDGALLGPKQAIETGVGVFGDGLAFDSEDNLYVIFDTLDGLALDESVVFVRPAEGGHLVRAFSASGKVYANLAFGAGAYGPTTLYLAMLQVVLVPGSPRGLERVEVGVTGAPLPPAR